ncbi:MAG: polysaccharide pyruvyl transferase family protein [Bacillota bacterium]|nr:polysaccharide pyruvyl transferase family protein [Bacillota bacterium]
MKKVGLVSVRNHNYGSILQAFAFQKVLDYMEIENEIIYYEKKDILKQLVRIFNRPLLAAKTKDVYKKVYGKFINKSVGYILTNRDNSFQDFIRNNLRFSKPYIGRKQLEDGANNYKAFVLGSDQVWNPMNLGSDFYTLTFVPDDMIKITYASSFGVSSIPKSQIDKTKYYLNRIQEISVREDSGSKLIKTLIDRDVPVVVDPTLLFDSSQWDSFIPNQKLIDEDYILCYFVGSNPEHRQIAKSLGKKTGSKVVLIPHVDEVVKADLDFSDENYAKVGPSEFVNLIRHAKYVCTDSFHATIFSIHYKKKFFVFNRFSSNNKYSMNTRLGSLLGALGLSQRLTAGRDNILHWYDEEINYAEVYEKLIKMRQESKNYLNNMAKLINRDSN